MIAEVHQEGFRTSRQWQRLTVRCQIAFFDRIFASNDGCCLDIADRFLFFTQPARMIMGYRHSNYNIRTQAAVHAVCDLLDVMAARAGNLDLRQALVIRSPLQDPWFSQVVQQHRFRQQFTIHGIAEELLVILDQAQPCLEIRCDMRDQAAWIRVMTAPACTGSIPEIQFILDFGENLVDRVLFFDISSGQQRLAAGFLARLIRVFLQDQRLWRFQAL